LTCAFSLLLVVSASCNGDEAEDVELAARPCTRLRDHLVDLRLEGVHGAAADLATHREAMRQALGDDFVAACEASMSVAAISCAATASDLAAASACNAHQVSP